MSNGRERVRRSSLRWSVPAAVAAARDGIDLALSWPPCEWHWRSSREKPDGDARTSWKVCEAAPLVRKLCRAPPTADGGGGPADGGGGGAPASAASLRSRVRARASSRAAVSCESSSFGFVRLTRWRSCAAAARFRREVLTPASSRSCQSSRISRSSRSIRLHSVAVSATLARSPRRV